MQINKLLVCKYQETNCLIFVKFYKFCFLIHKYIVSLNPTVTFDLHHEIGKFCSHFIADH